jgi:hypothetical protein
MPFPVSREDAEETYRRSLSFLSDFYIDFLGSVVPGLFAVVLATAVLLPSVVVFCHGVEAICARGGAASPPALSVQLAAWKDVGFSPYGNVGLLLVAAYILGSIFYRQDPKRPDVRSAQLVWRNTDRDHRKELAVQNPSDPQKRPSAYDVQFPYLFVGEYLEARGLTHLAKWIPWRGADPTTWGFRTKMFMNILKIRLQFLVPERCKEIIRNEAHVRMASSTWYAGGWIVRCAGIALGSVLAVATLAVVRHGATMDVFLSVVLLSLVVLALAWFIRWKIEKFIHYQRVREIVYVPEMAHFAQESGFNLHSEDFMT